MTVAAKVVPPEVLKPARQGGAMALAAFLLMFPGAFAYQTAVQGGMIPPVLGGFFTAAAIMAAPVVFVSYLGETRIRPGRPGLIGAAFALFLAFFLLVVLLGVYGGGDEEITQPHLAYVFKFVVIYFLMRSLPVEEPSVRKICVLVLWSMILFVVLLSSGQRFFGMKLEDATVGDYLFDYQGLALVYIVVLICALPSVRRSGRYLLYALSAYVLFLIGARSELLGLLVLVTIVEFCLESNRYLYAAILSALIAAAAYFVFSQGGVFGSMDVTNRVLNLRDLQSDVSFSERRQSLDLALHTIAAHPLVGNYASYPVGDYAHNILSAWVDFGLVGFLLFGIVAYGPVISLARDFRGGKNEHLFVIAFASAGIVAVLVSVSKAYVYQLVPVALGFYCRQRSLGSAR